MNTKQYIIQTSRIGFRLWDQSKDLTVMEAMGKDTDVMRFFPSLLSQEDTLGMMSRYNSSYEKNGYAYFAAEEISTRKLMGFIGLMPQNYEAPFTPCVDIGWRLSREFWGKGLATEGAKAMLDFGFKHLGLDSIYSVAPSVNMPSIAVMKKIGMSQKGSFKHPALVDFPSLELCEYYCVTHQAWRLIKGG